MMDTPKPARIAVVGPCASGKTSIVKMLRDRGLNAYSVAQEHSGIGHLWRHLEPDFVVYLDVDLTTIRRRRMNPHWPRWLFETQLERLAEARTRADVIVETDQLRLDDIVESIVGCLQSKSE